MHSERIPGWLHATTHRWHSLVYIVSPAAHQEFDRRTDHPLRPGEVSFHGGNRSRNDPWIPAIPINVGTEPAGHTGAAFDVLSDANMNNLVS